MELHTVKSALDELMGALLLMEEEDPDGVFELVEESIDTIKDLHESATTILTTVAQSQDIDLDKLKEISDNDQA